MDLFLISMQFLASLDINWWTGVVWITCGLLWCFISCLDSHSDGTHSLSKWCDAKFLQIWWRNKLIYILDGLVVRTFSANLNFWVNYSFKFCPNSSAFWWKTENKHLYFPSIMFGDQLCRIRPGIFIRKAKNGLIS